MRNRVLRLTALTIGLAACGRGGSAGTHEGGAGTGGGGGSDPEAGGSDAAGGSGGGGSGGVGGAGGGGIDAGADGAVPPEMSPGTATLRLKLAPGGVYCDQASTCQRIRHIFIRTSAGQGLELDAGDCPVLCDTCQPTPCPGIVCLPRGFEAGDEELIWDGSYYESSTCGSRAARCLRKRFAAPGRYLAVMCVTPGTISRADGGSQGDVVCRKTGDPQCIEVPFTFPSPSPVEGMLGGGAVNCGSAACNGGDLCVSPCCGGAPPPCLPLPDGGACPAGSSTCLTTPGGGPGCATPCTPPPPFCQPASKPLPSGCSLGNNRQVLCVCA